MNTLSPASKLIADRFIIKMNELGYKVNDGYKNQTHMSAWLRGNRCIEFVANLMYRDNIAMYFHTSNVTGRYLTIDEVEMLNPTMIKALHDCISSGKAELKEQMIALRATKQKHHDAVYNLVKHLPG